METHIHIAVVSEENILLKSEGVRTVVLFSYNTAHYTAPGTQLWYVSQTLTGVVLTLV